MIVLARELRHLERPGADACHLWRIAVDRAAEDEPDVLDESERARAARFREQGDRERFEVSHRALRHILGAYLARDPGELRFDKGDHGRPQLVGAAHGDGLLQFNLSHSGHLALIAVVGDGPVGVDVESLHTLRRPVELARRYMTAAEARAVESAAEAEKSATFLTCWTRKEAVLKSTGRGLTLDPRQVEVGTETTPLAIDSPLGSGERLRVRSLSLGEGYAGACATGEAVHRIELRDLHLN